MRRVLRVLTAALGAVVLGVATLFQPKARADDHWSASPKVQPADAASAEAGGGRPGAPPV